MKTVLVRTYVAHRMQDAYNAMTPEDRVQAHAVNGWTYTDPHTNEQVTISSDSFSYSARYEGTYGRWTGTYERDDKDQVVAKNVRPASVPARYYARVKHTVTIG